jgi:signal recognition particle receptor subunit beta
MAKKFHTCPYCFFKFEEPELRKSNNGKAVHKYCPNPETRDGSRTCGHYLPVDFMDHDTKTIAIYGGQHAGKSTYIASSVKMLIDNPDVRNYLKLHSSFLQGDDHSEYLINKYWNTMVQEKRFPNYSDKTDLELKKPIVLSIRNISTNQRIYLTFFDTPGEEFNDMENIVEEHPHICNSNAILFFIDPLQFPSMVDLILEDDKANGTFKFRNYQLFDRLRVDKVIKNLYFAIRSTNESQQDNIEEVEEKNTRLWNITFKNEIDSIREKFVNYQQEIGLRKNKPQSDNKVSIPTAFCLSKYDLIAGIGNTNGFMNFEYTDVQEFLGQTPSNGWIAHIDSQIKKNSKQIHDFLQVNEASIYQDINLHFSTYKIMGIAAAIAEDSDYKSIKLEDGKPLTKNLLYPLIWVLNELRFFN